VFRPEGTCPLSTAWNVGSKFTLEHARIPPLSGDDISARHRPHISAEDFVATVVKITGTSNTLAAFPSATVLLMISLAVEIGCGSCRRIKEKQYGSHDGNNQDGTRLRKLHFAALGQTTAKLNLAEVLG